MDLKTKVTRELQINQEGGVGKYLTLVGKRKIYSLQLRTG